MTVYIEYVILDNFFFTMLICCLSYIILREKVKKLRCIVASTIGTVCAVCYPFIKNIAWVMVFKCALFIVMCFILYLKLPKFIVHCVTFAVSTAFLGGVQFMIGFAVFGNVADALSLPVSDLPLSVYFIPPIMLFLFAKNLLDALNAHRVKQNYIYDLKLTVDDKTVSLKGLIDTGNGTEDVVFIGRLTALKLLGGKYLKILEGKGVSSMMIGTAAGNKKIFILPGKIELYFAEDEHIFMDVQVGISDLKTNSEYEAILPLSILGKEKLI